MTTYIRPNEHTRRIERRRGFQPPWYLVAITVCPTCEHETRVRLAGTYQCPQFPPGAIVCPHCEKGSR